MIGQANQGDSTHDYCPTYYNSNRYDCGMYNYQCGEKGRCPDNDTDDTKTHPDYYFHFRSAFLIGEMLAKLSVMNHLTPLAYTLLNNNKTIRFYTTFVLNS